MIDLHTHTNCSDGTDSPAQLVNKALAEGFSVLAITDHDTTSGWHAAEQALRPNLSLALGAEISRIVAAKAAQLKVEVNPRYGKWDPISADVVPVDSAGDAVKSTTP